MNYFVFDRALYSCEPTAFDKDYELKHHFPNASSVYSTREEALEEMKRLNNNNQLHLILIPLLPLAIL